MGVELTKAVALKQQRQARPREKRVKPVKRIEPTPEQQERNGFQSAGMAYKKTPVIDSLLAAEKITSAEYIALSYYRQQATDADKSPIKSNIDFSVRTGGNGPMLAVKPQVIETGRIERDLGQLQPIARAIAVDDVTPSQWAIQTSGGREKLQGKGIVIVPLKKNGVEMALMELRMAAMRITT